MTGNPTATQSPLSHAGVKTSRLVLFSGAVLAVFLVVGCAAGLLWLRAKSIIQTQGNLERLALALAEQTDRSLQGIDLVIRQARSEVDRLGGTAGQQPEELHRLLGTKIHGLPQGQALLLFSADGAMIAHSREYPTPRVNATDRDYFRAQTDMGRDDLFISEPMRNRVNNRWMVSLSRHYRGTGPGGFGGVVMAAVEVEYFSRLYEELQLPEGVSILLQNLDGTVLVRYPGDGIGAGASPLGRLGAAAPPAVLPLAGVPTLVAVHRLASLPLAVGLLLPEVTALAQWRALSWAIGLGSAAAVMAILALIALLTRQVSRLELREAACARLAAIVDSSGEAIVGQDIDGTIVSWNRGARIVYGYDAEEMIGCPVERLIPPEHREETARLLHRLRDDGIGNRWESERLRKDGTRIQVSVTLSPIWDIHSRIVGVSTIEHDITEAKRDHEELRRYRDHLEALVAERTAALTESNRQLAIAKEKAEAANRAKSSFLANMSHEIRTPMNAILGFAQIMQRSQTLPATDRENLDIIQRSGRNLLALINDILEMSKIEAGHNALQRQAIELHAMLNDIQEMFRPAAADKNLSWNVVGPDARPCYLVTDEGKLKQILINLVGNAVKFTEQGGVVLRAWTTEKDGGLCLLVEVEDTGIGVAAEEHERLFDAFFQAAGGADRGGTGLGLAISRRFANLIGGDITVSGTPKKGCVFRLTLPVGTGDEAEIPAAPPRRRILGLRPGHPEARILIVDDKADNRLYLRRLLEPVGFALREAANGKEAIAHWRDWRPHLIAMDIVMPVMDGHEAIRRIKAEPEGGEVTIIALSASAFEEDRESVMATGANDFLRKPVTEEDLLAAIGLHLNIEYDYAEDDAKPSATSRVAHLQPEMISRLPAETLDVMRQAVYRSDDHRLTSLVSGLPPELGDIAAAIRLAVAKFDWDILEGFVGPPSP